MQACLFFYGLERRIRPFYSYDTVLTMKLAREFYARYTPKVARDLLGQTLVRQLEDGTRLRGRIVETEAYHGMTDSACHAHVGRTPRTNLMFEVAGHAYVYLIYGMYDMLNIVTMEAGFPAAVLIRAIEPLEGIERMQVLRGKVRGRNLTNGPGKVCRAMAITRTLKGEDMTCSELLWVEQGGEIADSEVVTSPRIGIDYAAPEDVARHWRYYERGNLWVSKSR